MPYIGDSTFGCLDWSLTFARHSRLVSRAMTTLFCPGMLQKDSGYHVSVIEHLQEDLEKWRMSIPEQYRPKDKCQLHQFRQTLANTPLIWIHYLYYGFKLILLRKYLQVIADRSHKTISPTLISKSSDELIAVSRSILEIINFVDVEPSTPLW